MRKVRGWGFCDSKYPVKVDGQLIPSYTAWKNMLQRCYDPKSLDMYPTYIGCSIAPVWRGFSAFHYWYMENYRDGYALDKDILVPGNKTYGPETCRYVPQRINKLLTASNATRGDWPVGVYWHKASQRFKAQLNRNGHQKHLGCFDDPMEAFESYRMAKKAEIKRVALEAFLANEIKSDVYLALVRREIVPFPERT